MTDTEIIIALAVAIITHSVLWFLLYIYLKKKGVNKRMLKAKTIHLEELGEGLRDLRGGNTLKQQAELLGLTISHISELEHNRKFPSVNVIKRYAHRTNKNIILVFGGDS